MSCCNLGIFSYPNLCHVSSQTVLIEQLYLWYSCWSSCFQILCEKIATGLIFTMLVRVMFAWCLTYDWHSWRWCSNVFCWCPQSHDVLQLLTMFSCFPACAHCSLSTCFYMVLDMSSGSICTSVSGRWVIRKRFEATWKFLIMTTWWSCASAP